MDNLRKILKEEIDDFEWIREVPSEHSFTIDELYGKKIYFRKNNLSIKRVIKGLSQIKREDITFGDIRWSNY
jgi:hypothetical protein